MHRHDFLLLSTKKIFHNKSIQLLRNVTSRSMYNILAITGKYDQRIVTACSQYNKYFVLYWHRNGQLYSTNYYFEIFNIF